MTQAGIVIVDDDEAVQDSLRAILESFGYAVRTHGSGSELLENLPSAPADCLILDINLPQMSGWEVMERVQAMGMALPTILISGYVNEASAKRAEQSAANCLIAKPLDPNLLLSAIQQALAS